MTGNKIHSNEPLTKGYLGILEDSTYSNGEITVTMVATVSSVLAFYAMVLTAVGANNIVLLPTGITDNPTALVFRIKVVGEFENAIESAEVYHIAQVFLHIYT